jgi:alpha-tubulin suppressor-like RCC1 family protein
MRLKWKVEWPVRGRPGKYGVTLAARDAAGNLSDATRAVTVVIPLRVFTPRVQVAAGKRFAVRLATDGRAYHWKLAKRGGFASRRRLVLRAPSKPGRYTLVIRQDKAPHRIPVRVKQ